LTDEDVPAAPPRAYGKLAKRGIVWGGGREGARFFVLLLTTMIAARLLSPEESGIAAAAYFVMQLGGRLTQFGLGVSLVRAKSITAAHVSSVFVLNLLTGSLVCALFAVAGPFAGGLLGSDEAASILPVSGLGFLVGAFGSVPTALLSRDMRYRESTVSDLIAVCVYAVTLVLLAWLGYSYWSIVYSILASDIVRALCRTWMSKWVPSLVFSRVAAREVLSFGLGIYAKNLLEYFAQNVDNLIVGRLLGMAPLGYYDKAFNAVTRLSGMVNLAGPSVSLRAFALMQDDASRFRRAYRKVILSVTLVGYPLMAGVAVMAHELVEVLFGERWKPAALPLQVLCVAAMLRQLSTYASSATQAKGHIWSEVKRQAVSVAVLIPAVAALSPWGIAGAAVGVLISTLVSTTLLQVLVRNLTGLAWRDMLEPQLPGLACAGAVAATLMAVRHVLLSWSLDLPALTVLLVGATIGLFCAAAFLLFAPFLEMRSIVYETAEDLKLAFLLKRLPARLAPGR